MFQHAVRDQYAAAPGTVKYETLTVSVYHSMRMSMQQRTSVSICVIIYIYIVVAMCAYIRYSFTIRQCINLSRYQNLKLSLYHIDTLVGRCNINTITTQVSSKLGRCGVSATRTALATRRCRWVRIFLQMRLRFD